MTTEQTDDTSAALDADSYVKVLDLWAKHEELLRRMTGWGTSPLVSRDTRQVLIKACQATALASSVLDQEKHRLEQAITEHQQRQHNEPGVSR